MTLAISILTGELFISDLLTVYLFLFVASCAGVTGAVPTVTVTSFFIPLPASGTVKIKSSLRSTYVLLSRCVVLTVPSIAAPFRSATSSS